MDLTCSVTLEIRYVRRGTSTTSCCIAITTVTWVDGIGLLYQWYLSRYIGVMLGGKSKGNEVQLRTNAVQYMYAQDNTYYGAELTMIIIF